MESTNPRDILTTLRLVRAGLASGLLTKEEVIDWADNIITKDEKPDIFFIDLALSSSKSKNDIIHYFNEFLNFEKPVVQGRPLLGLLYKQYKSEQLNLEQTVRILFGLKSEAVFTRTEESFIYSIDNEFDLAQDNIHGSIENVRAKNERFLEIYKDYSINNFEQWPNLDKNVEVILGIEQQRQIELYQMLQAAQQVKNEKPWWKFW
jgi:hypothetical protein